MNTQYTITTTQKYNFPQPTMETALPQRLIQLSLHSLKNVQNNNIQLNQQGIHATQFLQPISLKPKNEPTIIAAVDTSSIKIGETTTGTLVAIRGANIWKQNRTYRYIRLGPFILHITEENKKEVYTALQNALNPFNENQNPPNLQQMPNRLANILERWLQKMLSKTLNNGIILFDGSLTSGTPDTPTKTMKEILETARKRENVVLAFSKMTNLRFNGHIITEILPKHKPPYMIEAFGLRAKPPIVLFGDVYVAKLSRGNYAFRLDIDKETLLEQRIEAVEKLLGNDLLTQGYPETLRLAHILCTFTANEVIAMQHYITRKCSVKIINRPDMHRLLFGVFGKGEGNS
ncbi:MAG: DNA double-strand break repair nuclease NurA [Candidatus Bathyarchaeia archaeon]|nr:DNA double-strand break repair nuclease NurA [Candidatus Bathyarchaeia archaeon]